MTIKLHNVKKKLLKNPKVRAEYERLGAEFALIQTMIEARTKAGLSQDELAERMGTTQSTVARLESGKQLPSLRTLYRYAEATGTKPMIKLVK
jgi:DNA-binding XRE family transcriptional regulator